MAIQIIDDLSCIRIVNGSQSLLINKRLIKTIDTPDNDTVRIDIGEGVLRHVYLKLSDVTIPDGLTDVYALREAIKDMLDTDADGENPTLGNQLEELEILGDINTALITGNGLLTTIKDDQLTASGLLTNIKDYNAAGNVLLTDIKSNQATQQTTLSNLQTGQGTQNTLLGEVKDLINGEQTTLQGMTSILTDIHTVLNAQSNTAFNEPLRIDESVPNEVYYGYAVPGTAEDGNTWAIKRVTREGEMILTDWTNGNLQFVNRWTDRYALNYGA